MKVTFNTRDPVYLQVVRYFKEQLATEKIAAGQAIPSRRELAASLKINPNTVQRAYKEMEDQKLIQTERNRPSRITTDEEVLKSIRSELLEESIQSFLEEIRPINVPVEELLALIRKQYERERGETEND